MRFISFTGVTGILVGALIIVLTVLVKLLTVFPSLQPFPLNSGTVTSIGLAYDMVGAILISYDAIAGTGILAQLSWYLKRTRIPLSERWLMLFYLRSPPLKKEKDGANPALSEIEQGRDMKNADLSKRAIGERPSVLSQYDQFRRIQRPAVIQWFGFVLLLLGFAMQFTAIFIPE